MKMNKNLVAAAVVTTLAAGTLFGTSVASAHMGQNVSSFAGQIAERFNLDAAEVETFMNEQHDQRDEQRQARRTERLQALVDAGTLTAEQKTALEAKMAEMHETRDASREQDLSREQMHEQMESAREAFEAWAEEQGIDLESIHPQEEMGRRGGQKFGR